MKSSLRLHLCISRFVIALLAISLPAVSLVTPSALARQAAAKTAPALSKQEREAAARVKVETLKEVTNALASKEMEGRGTGQPGADKAAQYIADRFAKIGLKPAGDAGTYRQAIKFKSEQVQSGSSFKAGDTTLKLKDDFVFVQPLPAELKEVNAGLVFAGYGVISPEIKRDDLAGINVKGKVVLLLGGKPNGVNDAAWAKASNQRAVFGRLITSGAAAIVVTYVGRETQPFGLASTYMMRRRVSFADDPQMPFKTPPFIFVSDEAAEKLFAGSGTTYKEAKAKAEAGEFASRDLGKQAAITIGVKREEAPSSNVVAVLEGSDAKLREEAVVYSAHYDAYGIETDGTIYPGAADNALGIAKLVAIAESLAKAKQKPRRSIIFLAVTGEEYGLLGAEYWVKHPTWPIEKVAANINYDGIGSEVWGPMKNLIDYGFKHSDLGAQMEGVASAMNIAIVPDPFPEEGVFYRSDHYAFFKKGVPSLYLIGAPSDQTAMGARAMKFLVTDYHMATDTVQKDWHWDGARDLAVMGLVVGMRIADQEAMPAWLQSSPYNRPRGTNLPPPARQ
ncbi:MAG: M28 family peptidase [Blastocatellia bacterium]